MPRDRSLDEFVADGTAESSGDRGADPESATPDEGDEEPVGSSPDRSPDVEPPSATFEWSPDGSPCESCGRVVSRLWNDDSGLTCRDCKDW